MENKNRIPTVQKQVRIGLEVDSQSNQMDDQIQQMSKVERMDYFLEEYDQALSGDEVRKLVKHIFEIDLDIIENQYRSSYPSYIMEALRKKFYVAPASTELDSTIMLMKQTDVMDTYLEWNGNKSTGPHIRSVINDIFGVNLDGISLLNNAHISLFSKGQWITRHDHDLFTVYTDIRDVEVKIYLTKYFTEQTGCIGLPDVLQEALGKLGYNYDKKTGISYYVNPTGEPVADSFKGQTLGLLMEIIQNNYSNLA